MIISHKRFECRSGEFSHSGDYGDTIFSLATVRAAALAGNDRARFWLYPSQKTTARMTPEHAAVIAPLIECQPYISEVGWAEYAGSNLDGWRDHLRDHKTILRSHMGTYGLNDPALMETPWLTIEEPKRVARYVITRTSRAHGKGFPWRELVEQIGGESVFVGLPEEHADFVRLCGRPVPFFPTKDLLEAAEVIAGCDVFLGVQTACHAIAEGLGKAIVREAPAADWLNNCETRRGNLISVYENESIPAAALADLPSRTYQPLPWRRAFSPRHQRAFWLAHEFWHRYNFNDILNLNPYRIEKMKFPDARLVVDVGGFIGLVSGLLADHWPDAELITFEPNPALLPLIGLNAPTARIIPAACHPSASWLSYHPADDPGSNSARNAPGWQKVPAVSLADATGGRHIDVLKLDCEGGEWDILPALHCEPSIIFGECHGHGGCARIADLLGDSYDLSLVDNGWTGIFHAVKKEG